MDYGNLRISVVNAEYRISREMRMPSLSWAMAAIQDGERYVLAGWVSEPKRIGLPLHIVEDGEFASSFGVVSGLNQAVDVYAVERIVSTNRASDIFAVNEWDYSVEAWSVDGRRIGLVKGPSLDDGQRDPDEESWSLAHPPWNRVRDIRVDASDRLWVIVQVRQADWKQHAKEVVWPDGQVALDFPDDDPDALYRSRVDVVDLSTCTMIASSWFEKGGLLSAFVKRSHSVGGMKVVELLYGSLGEPLLRVWEVDLS